MAGKKKKAAIGRTGKKQPSRPRSGVGDAAGIECYINSNWHDDGMATLLVFRPAVDGDFALAGFLIDVWCCGLKDAWGRLSLTRAEFEADEIGRASCRERV